MMTREQAIFDENNFAKPAFHATKRAVRHSRNVGRDTAELPESAFGVTYELAAECAFAKEDNGDENWPWLAK